MPDIKSILLLCCFLCFITGIFSPEVIIRWGIPSVKTRRRVLALFGSVTLLLVIITQIGESLPKTYTEFNPEEEPSNIFVFSPIEVGERMKIYKIAETGYTNHLEINILNQQTSLGNENYNAPEGYEFVQLDLRVTNKMNEPYTLDTRELQLQTGMLEVLTPTIEETTETTINLAGEETVELSLVYLQPIDESYLTLTYLPLATKAESNEEVSTEVSVSKIGEIIKTKQTMIQVHEVRRMNQSAKAGFEYIEVSLSIKNPSNRAMTYYPFHFELECSSSPNRVKSAMGISEVETLGITELASGGMVTGTLLFEVPKGATDLKLYYHEPSLFTKQTLEINLMETSSQSLPLQSEVVLSEQWKSVDELNNRQLKVLETELIKETKYTQAKEHHQFVAVRVELTNHSAENQEYTAFDFKLMNEQGRLTMPSLLLIDNQSELTSGTLAPQESVTGYLLFEDSDLYTTFYLLYSPDNWKDSECIIQPLQ